VVCHAADRVLAFEQSIASSTVTGSAGMKVAGGVDPSSSVAAAREAFSKRRFPWYDTETDDVRTVHLRQTWQWPNWNWRSSWSLSGLSWLGWFLIALLVLALLWMLFKVYRRRVLHAPARLPHADDAQRSEDQARIESLPFRVARRTADLLDEAHRYYTLGDLRQSMIYLFSHQLLELDRHQLIHLTQGKTNRQYLREMAPVPELRRLLSETMIAFEDVFFGDHDLDRRRFEACWNHLHEFDRLLEQQGP